MIALAALAPLLLPAVQAAIGIVEQIWKSQTNSGPQKKAAVMETLRVLTGKMVSMGTISQEPTDEVLSAFIEQLVAQANERAKAAFQGIPVAPLSQPFTDHPILNPLGSVTFKGDITIIGGKNNV